MSKVNVVEFSGREEASDPLTDLLRQGARDLIQQAVEAELAEFMLRFQGRRLDDGRALPWCATAISLSDRFRPALAP